MKEEVRYCGTRINRLDKLSDHILGLSFKRVKFKKMHLKLYQ